MGTREAKADKVDNAIFKHYSNGYYTGKDSYLYNFSRSTLATSVREMVGDYTVALQTLENRGPEAPEDINAICRTNSGNVRWDATLKSKLRARREAHYSMGYLRKTLFSALVVDRMPDLHCVSFGQCFPLWRYERQDAHQRNLLTGDQDLVKVDNIPETALRRFRVEYSDPSITRDDIFDYVYGVIHSSHYRDRFANDLAKGLPRIPFALDFRAFADAGAVLAGLHLNYEDGDFPEYPLEVTSSTGRPLTPDDYRLGTRPMRFADKGRRATLIVNNRVQLTGIPRESHRYIVNGRTPLEWLIFYYKTATDKRSGIVNDANEWFADPRDLVTTIQRIVYLSIETARIVDGLPDPLPDEVTEFTFELADG